MGKAAKSKREEMAAAAGAAAKEGDDDYQFKLPTFDEQAFIRRELLTARASFYTLGLGLAAGVVSVVLFVLPIPWYYGWLPIAAAVVGLRPFLQRMRFPEEVTAWKALFGSAFMMFFTALAVWILGVNLF